MDTQIELTKHERKRLRREERRKESEEAAKKRRLQRVLKIASVIGVIVILGFVIKLGFQLTGPKGPDRSVSYPIQSRDHVAKNAPHPAYNSNPPTGGWHYGETTEDGVHREEVADEYLVHNLEHGNVWIAYHPRIPKEVKEQLEKFGDESRLVITSRSANEHDVALVAWGRLDAFNLEGSPLDVQRVRDFIKRYRNQGPEKVPAGIHGHTEDEERDEEIEKLEN